MNRVRRNLPPIYDGIRDTDELSETVAIELDALDKAREQVENEQFIMTSSEKYIRIREKGWNIRADPTTESLDFRRRRIITRQSTRLPITQRRVHEILNMLVGEGNYEEHLNIEKCEAVFIFEATDAAVNSEIDYTLERMIPLNINLSIVRRLQNKMYVPSFLSAGTEITLYPMNIGNIEQNVQANVMTFMKTGNVITLEPFIT